jgi:hypothetical protein
MSFILILIISLVSALLFDLLPILTNARMLHELQKESLTVMRSPILGDDQKQKILFSISGKIFLFTMKLSCFFCIVVLPFLLTFFLENYFFHTSFIFKKLISLKGICFTTIGLLLFLIIKKVNEYL